MQACQPTTLEVNINAEMVIGVDIGGSHILGAVADLQGDILLRKAVALRSVDDGKTNLERLLRLTEDLCRAQPVRRENIRGIGIGVPAYVNMAEGIVTWSPAVKWRNLPLQSIIEGRFKLPVFVENDVNLAALGESRYGCARHVSNVVAIFIGTGIGAGLILDGGLYRGPDGAAGEIGYMLPTPSHLGQSYDQFGCLESLAAGPGIVHRAQVACQTDPTSRLANIKSLTAKDVFDAARAGDPIATQVISETIDYLAQAIANIVAILNPEMVVLGGGVARAGDLLLAPIKDRIQGTIPVVPDIVLSELGDEGVVRGAVALAIDGAL